MDLTGKTVLVVGSGISGVAATELLKKKNVNVVLFDGNKELDLTALREKHPVFADVKIILGELTAEDRSGLDLVVLSPGVPTDLPMVEDLKKDGIPIWGEIELAYHFAKGRIVAITGTNGKTTTATLLYRLFRSLGYKVGLISTVTYCIDSDRRESTHTTPDSVRLNRMMAEMVDRGCEYCFMEVSSHSLVQHRTEGLHFAGAVFTNITHDHLDYHHTFAEYIRAKKMLFDALGKEAFALTNADDRNGEVMLQNTPAHRYTYSLRTMADFRGRVLENHLDGTLMEFNGSEVNVLFTGRFNAYNLTAVFGTSLLLGWPLQTVLLNMSRLVPVAGRFQTFHAPNRRVTAIVDYAHTPDAVVNVLTAIREVVGTTGKIITVVGAGGNRDKGKRPIMASEAARLSDRVILTSDNPRFENPLDILADMEEGIAGNPDYRARTLSIADRRQAIRTAVTLADDGDVVLVAGKGHEDYQEVEGVKHHFDDREEVQAALAEKC